MSPHQREDVTRTIRVDSELGSALQGVAQEEGLSVNSLINRILWKHVRWDAYASKFGMMAYSSSSFARLLDHLTEEEVRAYSNEVGGLRTKEMIAFWFKEVSYQNYLKLLKTN